MTTGDLIDRVYDRYKRFFNNCGEVRIVVLGITDMLAEQLAAGDNVRLENLGTLAVQDYKQHATLFGKPNPNAGKVTRQVTFRDGEPLRRRMNPR